jgi:hypothetical protein
MIALRNDIEPDRDYQYQPGPWLDGDPIEPPPEPGLGLLWLRWLGVLTVTLLVMLGGAVAMSWFGGD